MPSTVKDRDDSFTLGDSGCLTYAEKCCKCFTSQWWRGFFSMPWSAEEAAWLTRAQIDWTSWSKRLALCMAGDCTHSGQLWRDVHTAKWGPSWTMPTTLSTAFWQVRKAAAAGVRSHCMQDWEGQEVFCPSAACSGSWHRQYLWDCLNYWQYVALLSSYYLSIYLPTYLSSYPPTHPSFCNSMLVFSCSHQLYRFLCQSVVWLVCWSTRIPHFLVARVFALKGWNLALKSSVCMCVWVRVCVCVHANWLK